MATSSAPDASPLTVLLRGKQYPVQLADTVGELRAAIEAATSVPAQSHVLLCRGKKLDAQVPDDAMVADFKLFPGAKVMLQVVPRAGAAAGGAIHMPESIARVRAIDGKVAALEIELTGIVERVEKLRLGFLDKEKTSAGADRIRAECRHLEESLMKQVLDADGLEAPDESERSKAQFRTERKALVTRIDAALKRCDDDAKARLDETVEDTFDEMKHRRGKPN